MPFPTGYNETDPADILLLKNEMNGLNGQISIDMDYGSVIASVPQSLDLINLPENNAESPTPTTGQLKVRDMFVAIDPEDLDAQQVDDGKLVYVQGLMSRDFGEDVSMFLSQLKAIFSTGASRTLANLNAALREQARYEVLFGPGTIKINKDQWRTARDS